jgi:hypothetical protein
MFIEISKIYTSEDPSNNKKPFSQRNNDFKATNK